MKLSNLNGCDDIGASCWFLESEGYHLMLDAGCHPKYEGTKSLPLLDQLNGRKIDSIAISHCHHDHVGALPIALRGMPEANVLMPELSYFLLDRVLHNSANVMSRQAADKFPSVAPLFGHRDIEEISPRFQGFRCRRQIEWSTYSKRRAGFPSPTLEFFDAGHTLGSAGIRVNLPSGSLFYTGDVSFGDQTILKGADFSDVKADVLIMETTRGNRQVAQGFTRPCEVARLEQSILEVIQRKGCVLIPVFALGRTQEILALLADMMRRETIRKQPIYIGGLGRVFTETYDNQAHKTRRNQSELKLCSDLDLVVIEKSQLEKMRLQGGKIFVLTAGMMSEHTAAHDLATRLVGHEQHGIFFVGYTDPDTPGGKLRYAKPGDSFHFSDSGGWLTKKCDVKDFDLTAHANREELVDFVAQVEPRKIVLGHGAPECKLYFENTLKHRYPSIQILTPAPGECVEF